MRSIVPVKFGRPHLLAIGGIALLVRLMVYVALVAGHDSHTFWGADSQQYLTLGHHFGDAFVRSTAEFHYLSVFRTPGYPLFASAVFAIVDSIGALIVVQLVVASATACLAAVFANRLVGPRGALVAGFIVAMDPVSIITGNLLLTETLFTFVLLGASFALWRSLTGDWRWALLAGALFATAALTRPVALYMLPVVVAVALTSADRRRLVAVVVSAAFVIPLGGWVVRNRVVDEYTGLSSVQETNLLLYRAAGAVSHDTGVPLEIVQSRLKSEAEREAGPSPTSGREAAVYRRLALHYLSRHPKGAVYATAKGFSAIVFGPGGGTWATVRTGDTAAKSGRVVNAGLLVVLLLELVGALIGFLVLFRSRRWRDLAVVCGLPLYFLAISAGPEAYSRFRVPLVPFFALSCAIALCRTIVALEPA